MPPQHTPDRSFAIAQQMLQGSVGHCRAQVLAQSYQGQAQHCLTLVVALQFTCCS